MTHRNKDTDNSRNGHSSKTLRTSYGDVAVAVPRDRKGEFEPQIPQLVGIPPYCLKQTSILCLADMLGKAPR